MWSSSHCSSRTNTTKDTATSSRDRRIVGRNDDDWFSVMLQGTIAPPIITMCQQEQQPNSSDKQTRETTKVGCDACMYTGVGVCLGLSVYFANLAMDITTLNKNKRFLWCCSAGSVAAAAYRWYLGPI